MPVLDIHGDPTTVLSAYSREASEKLTAEENLQNHPGRQSDSIPCMSWVRVTNRSPHSDGIAMGDDIQVEVKFRTPEPMNGVTFWVFVKNNMGTPVFGVDTDINPPEPTARKGSVCSRFSSNARRRCQKKLHRQQWVSRHLRPSVHILPMSLRLLMKT